LILSYITMKDSVYIQTFGCQMNKLDSELIANALADQGYNLVNKEESADVILLNACSVRAHAEERVYNRLSLLKKYKITNPKLIIGLVGCMAQKDKAQAFERIPHLDLVCGPHRYKTLAKLINDARTKHNPVNCTDQAGLLSDENPNRRVNTPTEHHAYIQAMRGCDNYCSYCIVPYVRGKEVSRSVNDITTEAKTLASQGVRDITLLGQNITAYGKPSKSAFINLLHNLHSINSIDNIGFITGHPAFVTDELLKTMASLPKIRRELHMPAQSGSDRILKDMNRGYTSKEYSTIIKQAYRLMPDVKIISDFIVGFPSESEDDFQATVDLVKTARFSKIFVFKYSPRSGTTAAKMTDDIPMAIKKERNNTLLKVQKETHRNS